MLSIVIGTAETGDVIVSVFYFQKPETVPLSELPDYKGSEC